MIRKYLLIVLIFIGQQLFADDLYDASILEREGAINRAVELYDKWLIVNTKNERFSEIFFHCASIIPSVDDTLEFLFKYKSYIENKDRQKYFSLIAQTYELLFQYENASKYYRIASVNPSGNINYQIYLKHLQLDYQMGILPDESELNNILISSKTSTVYVDALIFKAEILKYNGEFDKAVSLLLLSERKEFHPEIYYALWEIYLLENNVSAVSSILDLMKKNFPDSIELSLMEGKIKELPRLSKYFIKNTGDKELSYVQIGSFTNNENINSLSDLLKSKGYDFFYIKESNLTKIIVTASIPADQLLLDLKSNGFEGFSISYP